MSKAVRNQLWVTGQTEKSISQLTMHEIRIEMMKAVATLKETQMDVRRMRELWLEEISIKNAMANGYMDAQKVLKTMIRKIHMQSMNSKLNMVTHGERAGLDHIEIPKGEWFYSCQTNELYRYNEGVFEAYPWIEDNQNVYHKQHVLKVILDDTVTTMVEESDQGYRINTKGGAMQWKVLDSRKEMEKHLLQ